MAKGQERRLRKLGHLEAYNRELQKFIDRGCVRRLTDTEMKEWTGPVNYILHHGVPKPGSLTTPLRIVSNSSLNSMNSGHNYNEMLAKGPNALMLLIQVLIMWQTWENCIVWDLHKVYNAM